MGAPLIGTLVDDVKRLFGGRPQIGAPPQQSAAPPVAIGPSATPRIGAVAPGGTAGTLPGPVYDTTKVGSPLGGSMQNNLPPSIGAPQGPNLAHDVATGQVPQPTPPGVNEGTPSIGRMIGWTLAGRFLGPKVGEQIINGPRERAEKLYGQQEQEWQRAQQQGQSQENLAREQALNAEQIKNMESEIKTRENPVEKPSSEVTHVTPGEMVRNADGSWTQVGTPKPGAEHNPAHVAPGEFVEQPDGSWKQVGTPKNAGEEGSWTLDEDAQGNPVLFNSKTAQVRPAPAGVLPKGTFDKRKAAADKENKPYQDILDKYANAQEDAAHPTGPGDYEILMAFVNATKPSTGFRFTDAERRVIQSARSLGDAATAKYDEYAKGPFLGPEQRQQMMDILGRSAKQAQSKIEGSSGSSQGAAGAPPPGANVISLDDFLNKK